MSHEAAVRTVSQGVSTDQLYRAESMQLLKRIMFVVMVLSVLLVLLNQKAALIQLVDHPISQLKVEGEFKSLKAEQISDALSGVIGSGFLMVDLLQIKARVEQLPWVHSAMVKRVWPGEIQLTVQEQEPVSYWNQDSFLNAQGHIFSPEYLNLNFKLPKLVGVKELHAARRIEMLTVLEHINSEIKQYGVSVQTLELNPRGVWEAQLNNDIQVALGVIHGVDNSQDKKLNAKLERVGKIFTNGQRIELDQIEKIDARYPNGVAIKWKKVSLVAGANASR